MKKLFIFLGLVLILLSSFVSAISGGISYWNMNNNLLDQWGSYDLTNNGVTFVTSYPTYNISGDGSTHSADFEKTETDYFSVGDHDDFSYTDGAGNDKPFSVCWRQWVESHTTTSGIIGKIDVGGGGEFEWVLQLSNAGLVQATIYTSNGGAYLQQKMAITGTSSWDSFCYSYDGSETIGGTTLYRNGDSSGTTAVDSGGYTGMTNTTVSVYIGCYKNVAGLTDYFDGKIDNPQFFDREITVTEATNYYNYGTIEPPVTFFELTALNYYNTTLLNNFTANFTNVTGTTSITTNNGTIYYPDNQIVDILVYDVENKTYFNKSYTNYNTSTNKISEHWQSVLILIANESNTNSLVGSFNATVGGQFNTSNSTNYTTFYLNSGTYTINGRSEKYFTNATKQITLNNLDSIQDTLFFANHINITVFDNTTQQIYNFSVKTDDGYSNSTLDGNLTVFCSYPDCDLTINATWDDYLIKQYSNIWSSEIQANLTSGKIFLRFIESDTLNGINNANITIRTPDGRTLNLFTNALGYINTSLLYNESAREGEYNITFNPLVSYISPINFSITINESVSPFNETFTIGKVGLTFNIYDRETGLLLAGVPGSIFMIGNFNVTTSTGQYTLSNLTLITGDKTVVALSSGYFTEQINFDFTGLSANVTIDFYLLNLTGVNTGTLFATTIFDNRLQQDARISLYEYFPSLLSYVKVSECSSNINGECTFAIQLNSKIYFLTASKTIGGIVYTTLTNAEIIVTTDDTRTLVLSSLNIFTSSPTKFLDIIYSETFINNISTISLFYQTNDNVVATVCVDYYRDDGIFDTLVYNQCVNASSSYVATPVLLNRSNTYFANIYQLVRSDKLIIQTYNYPSMSSFESIFSIQLYLNPIFVWLWMALLIISLLMKSMEFFSIGGIILSWVTFYNMPTIAIGSVSALKTVILITMLRFSRRKEDLT